MNTNNASSSADQTDFLNAIEVRVLAVLAEKEAATPDNYPLSLNAIVNACNQLSSRDPVMSLNESEVVQALELLTQRKLVNVVQQAGARVVKYEHRMRLKWMIEQNRVAALTTLMLRGWQTAGEIRARSGRLYEFASIADVESSLEYLSDKYPPLVIKLARAPGSKESRYAHLLSGDVLEQSMQAPSNKSTNANEQSERIAQLEAEVLQLKAYIAELEAQFLS
jgi:uncharacterized protein YceH (UPF0502 family)